MILPVYGSWREPQQMGRDSSAVSLFHRLGSKAMSAEDHYLLGLALTRSGNGRAGLEVWELARAAEPNSTDTLPGADRGRISHPKSSPPLLKPGNFSYPDRGGRPGVTG